MTWKICGSSPFFRSITSPSPDKNCQLSVIVLCVTAFETPRAGSVQCTRLYSSVRSINLISEPSGAISSGSDGKSKCGNSDISLDFNCCISSIIYLRLKHGVCYNTTVVQLLY